MNKLTRTIVDTCCYLVAFLFVQIFCTSVGMLLIPDFQVNGLALSLSLLASSVITAAFYWWRNWWTEDVSDVKGISWTVYCVLLIVALSSFLPSLALLELMGVEPNEQQERLMMDIISSPLGFLIIAVVVPLAEEIVFRGAILRTLLDYFSKAKAEEGQLQKVKVNVNVRQKDGIWISIVISAILFGFVHGNLAQFIHATLLGILFGWIYCNTKSIVPGIVLHFLNNGITFLLVTLNPEANDASLMEMYDGNSLKMAIHVAFSVLMLIYSVWRLNMVFLKKQNKE